MARWSTFTDGSSVDCRESVGAYQGSGCRRPDFVQIVKGHDNNANDPEDKQKWLFNQLLSVHFMEKNSKCIIHPVPVVLGDGQSLDLYNLFRFVKEKGGYNLVSKEGLWGSVAKELGLNLEVFASVKLVYDKYLNEFEGWLKKTCGRKKFKSENHGFKSIPLELEKEFRGLFFRIPELKDDVHAQLESSKISKCIDLVNHKSEMNILDNKNQPTICEDDHIIHGDDDLKFINGVEDVLPTMDSEVTKEEVKSRKRKREPLSAMLKWMRKVARRPLRRSIEPIPEPSKWKEYKGTDFWAQILRAKEALLVRPCVAPTCEQSSFQKLKMHPAMYEDHVAVGQQSIMKVRCSKRVLSSVKSQTCACCTSCSAIENKLTNLVKTEAENAPIEKTTAAEDLSTVKGTANSSTGDNVQKQVAVGPRFQAEVPKWTGVISEIDSKWLGTQVWPINDNGPKPTTGTDLIGKGRQEKCSCQVQGSVECVRFHIAEKRMKLKLELGSVFYHWGFDAMGEEVSLQWTSEEEKKFKDIMMSNLPSQNRRGPIKHFPKRTRRSLVSYYFNAFVIQRRIYQNRVTPNSIDSDDDEREFGSFSDGFGMGAVKDPGSNFLECSQNNQCTDLE